MAAEKRYDLRVGGQILWELSEADVLELFRSGRIDSSTPCRLTRSAEWRNVNEYFPLLKYGLAAWEGSFAGKESASGGSGEPRAGGSRWKIGIACFALGAVCAGAVLLLSRQSNPPPRPEQTVVSHLQAAQPLYSLPAPQGVITRPQHNGVQRRYTELPREQSVIIRHSPPARAETRSVVSSNRAQAKAVVKPEEVTIPLNQWTMVPTSYGSFRIKIYDHGPVTISVWLGYGEPRRIEKQKGFETDGTNIVQIYALPGAKVYYVDRIGVSPGYCVLKIIPDR